VQPKTNEVSRPIDIENKYKPIIPDAQQPEVRY
jgi:hypothetical protein